MRCILMSFSCCILFVVSLYAHDRYFIENKGQWPDEVRFLARTDGMDAWITEHGIVFDYYEIIDIPDRHRDLLYRLYAEIDQRSPHLNGHILRFEHYNGNLNTHIHPQNKHEGYYNFIIGNDPVLWSSFVGIYDEVHIKNIYDGINIRYYFDREFIRYDYIVEPGADVSNIKLKIEGPNDIQINDKGELILMTGVGAIHHGDIYAYQLAGETEHEIECRYQILDDSTVGFQVSEYDKTKSLVIDPLVYSSYLGGTQLEDAYSIAVDGERNVYLVGRTVSPDYPTTSGAYDENHNAKEDAVITKLDPDEGGLIYSTYLGGVESDFAYSIVLDNDGNAYISGCTYSEDFPTTSNAFSQSMTSFYDIFIVKLNPAGSSLLYSTYLGGSGLEAGRSIVRDDQNNVYVTGFTTSADFPVTDGAFSQDLNGQVSAFVTKLNAAGSALIYSTFIGGSDEEWGNAIIVDEEGNAYVTGFTSSADFPVSPNAFDRNYNGVQDAYVFKLNSSGTQLVYSSFLGGTDEDRGMGIAIDNDGNVYATGRTNSTDFPITEDAFQKNFSGEENVYVIKLNPSGSDLMYSTFLGGSDREGGNAIAVDDYGNAYITGFTSSDDFPTTEGAYRTSRTGAEDVFISKVDNSGSSLFYSTYLGGSGSERGWSITIDEDRYTYVAGSTTSSDFPVTVDAISETMSGSQDIFFAKLNLIVTSVDDSLHDLPAQFRLFQNYPNPFNPFTKIRYGIPERSVVRLTIYNMLGQEIETLVNQYQNAGYYEVTFDASDLPSGIYIYRLHAGDLIDSKKLILMQ